MSVISLILGSSGTGKTASLRNFNSQEVLLIQPVKKPLPFRSKEWKVFTKDGGNIFQNDSSVKICEALARTKRKIIIIDDFQYIMCNEFMRRSHEKSYDKFNDIARNAWDIITTAANLPSDVRVYFLSHIDTNDFGKEKAKTIGKMLDDKITIEGLFSIVLKTAVRDGEYFFTTKNSGNDTVKSPIDLFDKDLIDNDLAVIDAQIVDFYELTQPVAQQQGE
jgi:hypothetical protein